MAGLEYQCCYCDADITEADSDALRITLSGLWAGNDGAAQEVYSHSQCADQKFGAALSPSVPFDVAAFAPD